MRDELGAAASPLAAHLRAADEPAVATLLPAPQLAAAHADGARLGLTGAVGYATRSRGRRSRPRSGWASLTPTEHDVVALAARGLSNQAIGAELLVAPGTVRTHLRSVFGKLGVTSRVELAALVAHRDL